MCSSGIRETIQFLVQNKLVDCIVTTAGGVEEDFIKCMAPTFVGTFELKGSTLRESGINRIGNLVIPNDNYCKFEDWVMPLLDEMVTEQKEHGKKWTPSKIIEKLGKPTSHKDS
jgi:deoxyhypusine synthase